MVHLLSLKMLVFARYIFIIQCSCIYDTYNFKCLCVTKNDRIKRINLNLRVSYIQLHLLYYDAFPYQKLGQELITPEDFNIFHKTLCHVDQGPNTRNYHNAIAECHPS